MRNYQIITIVLLTLVSACTAKLFYSDGTISDGDNYDTVIIKKVNTPPNVTMLDGFLEYLYIYDGTFNMSGGTIHRRIYLRSNAKGRINITGGDINKLVVFYNTSAQVHVTGGDINNIDFTDAEVGLYLDGLEIAEPVVHIYAYNYAWDSNGLTGNWEDGTSFSISITAIEMERVELHDIGAEICQRQSVFDTNEDCKVDFIDLSQFSSDWLDCGYADPNDC